MTREEAYQILTKYLKNQNLIKHSLAAEATMKDLYKRLHAGDINPNDEEKWGIVGLLHDADYELAQGKPEVHGLLLFNKESAIPQDIANAIKSHNPATKIEPKAQMDWAIYCADQLTGLIVAATLVHPDKKLASVTPDFVLNRMKEKSFAKGADRKPILLCEEKLGIPLKEFVSVTLSAMQSINKELGL